MVSGWRGAEGLRELLVERCSALARLPALGLYEDVLSDIACHAWEPLRVAITGDVSTGKTSLVRALLGEQVGTVSQREATAEVTWFRAPDAPVPAMLGRCHTADVVSSPLAKMVTLVDTPGVNSTSGNQKVTEEMLRAGTQAAGVVTTLIYLVNEAGLSSEASERLREFSALIGGPFGCGTGAIICGSKADLHKTGSYQRGSADASAAVMLDIERQAGGLAEDFVAVMPSVASASRSRTVRGPLLDDVRAIAGDPDLRDGVARGWDTLSRRIEERGLAIDVKSMQDLLCGRLGLQSACEMLASERPEKPAQAVRQLWRSMSGLARLEAVLDGRACDAVVFTSAAVMRRLELLASDLGSDLGRPIRELLDEIGRDEAMMEYQRHAAAIVLEGRHLAHFPEAERLTAACTLRGEGGLTPDE
jgi:50S ribosome-binding GTPase